MIVLGIETSCDETAAAVVDSDRHILSSLVLSQLKAHRRFGGVVPEVAARNHLDHLHDLIAAALEEAGTGFEDLDGVAATAGPGLIGGVMVGMMAGKAIAAARGLPFLAVNHLEGHALTPRLTDNLDFPYLLLLVSGGHTQILAVEGVGKYRRWGTTLDDAAGECFDKSAKLMGLGYPGGPRIEEMAVTCPDLDSALKRFSLPKPMLGRREPDFSFSGLKTAIRQHVEALPAGDLKRVDIADLCAAFQHVMAEILAERCSKALDLFEDRYNRRMLVVAGGVAANQTIRKALRNLGAELYTPPLELCGDNAAMIAWAGLERLQSGQSDPLNFKARPRWPLDPDADPRHGAGVKA